ncbi:MAG: hypothetical protein QOD31_1439 [Pseudonocardiales bacterium]|jgi:hypothetical protein|nr:hypothetical protein [Pseudonocardiales bacterium]
MDAREPRGSNATAATRAAGPTATAVRRRGGTPEGQQDGADLAWFYDDDP